MFGAELGKGAQIALGGPVKLSLDLLVMNPDHVGGDNVHAGGFHLEDFFFPLRSRIAGEMKFAHDWKPGLPVMRQKAAVQAERDPARGGCGAAIVLRRGRSAIGLAGIDADGCANRLCVKRRNGRSEERRVGKECRSRWSPY